MSWLSNLWEGVKSTAANVYDTVKNTAQNWSEGKFLAPGAYKFCGPGNPLDENYVKQHLPGANPSDQSCYQHDKDYENFKKLKDQGQLSPSELKNLVRESDDRLIANLRKDPARDLGSYLSEMGIRGKKFAEDLGLLSPEKFVT
jgi:hypothetical protein